MQERPVPKKNSDPRNQRPEPRERYKLYQLVLDMKAEMGSIRKAMMNLNAGISCDKVTVSLILMKTHSLSLEELLLWESLRSI